MCGILHVVYGLLFVVLIVTAEEPEDLDSGNTLTKKCGIATSGSSCNRAARLSMRPENREAMFARIVGGEEAIPGEFPFMVSMGKRYDSRSRQYSQQCGGSIITSQWILTAAHCFFDPDDPGVADNNVADWYLKFGAHDVTTDADTEVQPAQIITHPNYDPEGFVDDIALVKLSSPLTLGEKINTVCLHQKGVPKPAAGTKCIVAGWGQTAEGGHVSDKLLKVGVDILQDSACSETADIVNGMMCAGFEDGRKDSCGGDSGGPLFCPVDYDDNTTHFYQVGVVSFGAGCARPNFPGVYADVAVFIDWIKTTIANN